MDALESYILKCKELGVSHDISEQRENEKKTNGEEKQVMMIQ